MLVRPLIWVLAWMVAEQPMQVRLMMPAQPLMAEPQPMLAKPHSQAPSPMAA